MFEEMQKKNVTAATFIREKVAKVSKQQPLQVMFGVTSETPKVPTIWVLFSEQKSLARLGHKSQGLFVDLHFLERKYRSNLPTRKETRGYIRLYQENPFGMGLWYEEQVRDANMVVIACNKKHGTAGLSVMHVDATGGLFATASPALRNMAPIYLYSSIFQNHYKWKAADKSLFILTHCDFLSTFHSVPTISNYLIQFARQMMLLSQAQFLRPMIICTDMCSALMNGTCMAFNGCKLRYYLADCWEIIAGNWTEHKICSRSILQICTSHFLNYIKVQLRNTGVYDSKVRSFIMACFGLMVTCTKLTHLGHVVLNVAIVFGSELRTDAVKIAWNFLQRSMEEDIEGKCEELADRLDQCEVETSEMMAPEQASKYLKEMRNQHRANTASSVCNSVNLETPFCYESPFYQHFLAMLQLATDLLSTEVTNAETEQNVDYLPIIVKLINDFMHLFPLITGLLAFPMRYMTDTSSVIIPDGCLVYVTNRVVEGQFKCVK